MSITGLKINSALIMTNNNRDFMPEVGKHVFQEVKYVINAVGCSEK